MNDGRMSGGVVRRPIGQCHRVLPYKESGRWRGRKRRAGGADGGGRRWGGDLVGDGGMDGEGERLDKLTSLLLQLSLLSSPPSHPSRPFTPR